MQRLHAVIAVDRAGLVGEDGETHHGVFDVGFLRQAPNMTILCPASGKELKDMMRWAVLKHDGPVAIRYPRGSDRAFSDSAWDADAPVVTHRCGKDCALITYGTLVNNAIEAAQILEKSGINVSVIRLTRIHPIPVAELSAALTDVKHAVIIEETCNGSGIYEAVAWSLRNDKARFDVSHIDLGDKFVPQGGVDALYRLCGLDPASVAEHIQEVLNS